MTETKETNHIITVIEIPEVVGVFDNRDDFRAAFYDLRMVGFSRYCISLLAKQDVLEEKLGKTEADLLAASQTFQQDFVAHGTGVLRRELVRKPDGTYLEIVQFRSHKDYLGVMKKEMETPVCAKFVSVMDLSDFDPEEGWTLTSHLRPINKLAPTIRQRDQSISNPTISRQPKQTPSGAGTMRICPEPAPQAVP